MPNCVGVETNFTEVDLVFDDNYQIWKVGQNI